MILQKGRLFFRQTLRRRKGLGTTREDRDKGLSLTGYPQIILLKLLQSLSGLLSFLAAALARKYVSKSSRARVSLCNVARVSEPRTIFTRRKNDLYQKLIAFQKRDGHTYIHTTLAANLSPTVRDPMPRANALGNYGKGSL